MTVEQQETAVSKNSLVIPLIDFSQFLNGTPEERLAVSKAVAEGFKTAGFIYLKNHGIPPSEVASLFSQSAEFFSLPIEEKNKLAWTSPRSNRGYISKGREKVTRLTDKTAVQALAASTPDIKETLEIGREGVPEYPNHWPPSSLTPTFKPTILGFHASAANLHLQLMSAIALGLGLPEIFFNSFCDKGDNTLRLLHYPSAEEEVFKKTVGAVRAGAHTDYGSVTLLWQDMTGGLQVLSPEGVYVDATPIEGTVVINAGDLLSRWSNGVIQSTEHRVIQPPMKPREDGTYPPRYSCAYFCNPNFDAEIEALPGTYKNEADKKYGPINSGEYLAARLESTIYG